MDSDVLRYCMHIPECPFQRTACVQRARTGTVIDQIDCLHCAGNGMRCGQPNMGSRLRRDLTATPLPAWRTENLFG